jgi:hypothetical protein
MYLSIYQDANVTQWGLDIADAKVDMMLEDEAFHLSTIELLRELDEQKRHIDKPFMWDSPIMGEWEPMDIEDTAIEHSDNQDLAATALQAAIYALKRCDTALQDIGIDDEEFKAMALYCEQSLRNVNGVQRLW